MDSIVPGMAPHQMMAVDAVAPTTEVQSQSQDTPPFTVPWWGPMHGPQNKPVSKLKAASHLVGGLRRERHQMPNQQPTGDNLNRDLKKN